MLLAPETKDDADSLPRLSFLPGVLSLAPSLFLLQRKCLSLTFQQFKASEVRSLCNSLGRDPLEIVNSFRKLLQGCSLLGVCLSIQTCEN